jgi:hypothetical protein
MNGLIHQRCWHHPSRQAVVRCPVCRRYYCRECVTEHRGRMMCAACVESERRVAETGPARVSGSAAWIAFGLLGLFLAWVTFYYLGVALARVPSDFFE